MQEQHGGLPAVAKDITVQYPTATALGPHNEAKLPSMPPLERRGTPDGRDDSLWRSSEDATAGAAAAAANQSRERGASFDSLDGAAQDYSADLPNEQEIQAAFHASPPSSPSSPATKHAAPVSSATTTAATEDASGAAGGSDNESLAIAEFATAMAKLAADAVASSRPAPSAATEFHGGSGSASVRPSVAAMGKPRAPAGQSLATSISAFVEEGAPAAAPGTEAPAGGTTEPSRGLAGSIAAMVAAGTAAREESNTKASTSTAVPTSSPEVAAAASPAAKAKTSEPAAAQGLGSAIGQILSTNASESLPQPQPQPSHDAAASIGASVAALVADGSNGNRRPAATAAPLQSTAAEGLGPTIAALASERRRSPAGSSAATIQQPQPSQQGLGGAVAALVNNERDGAAAAGSSGPAAPQNLGQQGLGTSIAALVAAHHGEGSGKEASDTKADSSPPHPTRKRKDQCRSLLLVVFTFTPLLLLLSFLDRSNVLGAFATH